jgi:cytochrome c peroxidase
MQHLGIGLFFRSLFLTGLLAWAPVWAFTGTTGTAGAATPPAAQPPMLQLQVHTPRGPLKMNRLGQTTDLRQRALAVSRLDLLLSGLALQRADGSWVTGTSGAPVAGTAGTAGSDWHAFFRAEQPERRQPLPALPPGTYQALRFTVGVSPAANHADPNRLGPDDPLHPLVNGMHWGWTGGYVFTALEGHWQFDQAPAGSTGGFSYHLAGNDNRVVVTLPGPINLGAGTVLRLQLNAQRLLSKVDIARHGESTHSRSKDPLVLALSQALQQAFTVVAVQEAGAQPATAKGTVRGSTAQIAQQPYPVNVGAHMPSVAWPEDNRPTVQGVALGRRLFEDPRLSRDGSLSCASCHRPGHAGADPGKPLSTGVGGQPGRRNTMPLFNLAWAGELGWDGRTRGLRRQALLPITAGHEMAEALPRVVAKLRADPALAQQFQQAFGGGVNAERVGLALEQYLLTLVSQDSRFDRMMKGSERFTAQEKRGFELFLTEHDPAQGLRGGDCFHCHGGALFTNHQFMDIGLPARGPGRKPDAGRQAVTADPADHGKFRTPSLRNVAVTGPYMHDGRFKTLEEVVNHYDHGVQRRPNLDPNLAKHPAEGMQLTAEDKAALVAFLRTLTDPAFVPRGGAGPSTQVVGR